MYMFNVYLSTRIIFLCLCLKFQSKEQMSSTQWASVLSYILKPKSEAQGCGASAQSEPDHRMQEIRSRGCFCAYPENNHLCAYPQNDHLCPYAPQKHLYIAPFTTSEQSILLCFSCRALLMRCSCQKFVLQFCTQGLFVQLRIVW